MQRSQSALPIMKLATTIFLRKDKMFTWNPSQNYFSISQECQNRVRWIQPYSRHTSSKTAGWFSAKRDFTVGTDPSAGGSPEASPGAYSNGTSAEQFMPWWHLWYATLFTHMDNRKIKIFFFRLSSELIDNWLLSVFQTPPCSQSSIIMLDKWPKEDSKPCSAPLCGTWRQFLFIMLFVHSLLWDHHVKWPQNRN